MDYHFVSPEDSISQIPDDRRIGTIIKKISPILIISAILPVFLFFLYNPPETALSPRADVKPELRIWFKPNIIVLGVNETYEAKVYASLDNKKGFVVENLQFEVEPTDGVLVADRAQYFDTPFAGQQELGIVRVTARSAGEQQVRILQDSMFLLPQISELDITTSPLTVIVE